MKKFTVYRQHDAMDCGPTCLQMIARHYGADFGREYLYEQCSITKNGVSMHGISQAAETIGLRTMAVKVSYEKLVNNKPLPCILHWNQNHFVVLISVKGNSLLVADPGHGIIAFSKTEFQKCWKANDDEGVALLLEPTEQFPASKKHVDQKIGYHFLLKYIKPYYRYIFQLFLGMAVGSLISLVFPYLMQQMVDKGINGKDVGIVQLVLISQLLLFAGNLAIELIKNWLLLHVNSRINISIISDFLLKLMNLPIRFFDTKLVGDIKQRLGDHSRIQSFMTGTTFSTVFSIINIITFTVILGTYNKKILLAFALLSILGIVWIILFLKRRKKLDYIRFQQMSENEGMMFELISGMQEIKQNNSERMKRWDWERVQAKLYFINISSLALGQYQQIGSSTITQFKNILVSYIAAREVIAGNMTLGMMMGISYIIGQLNAPVQSILTFIQSAQDAKISIDRLNEIHTKDDEHTASQINYVPHINKGQSDLLNISFPAIYLEKVSFRYSGPASPFVLKNIDLSIPQGKVTAIVGMSGSGKTTLMKLLLKYYDTVNGTIRINNINIAKIAPASWRSQTGVVMQDGYIFSDTILRNISMGDEEPDMNKLDHATSIANIKDYIDQLPLKYHTTIGNTGVGLSAGQKQRILIARAVYKNPEFIFLDEATSALDANNEKTIMQKMNEFYEGKTVVVIAHRLSTVKNADQIVVLEDGAIVEKGSHDTLVKFHGKYYELIKNQLELEA